MLSYRALIKKTLFASFVTKFVIKSRSLKKFRRSMAMVDVLR